MGGSKANFKENNNNTEFLKTRPNSVKDSMVNSRQPRQIASDIEEDDYMRGKVIEGKEPDNWSLYDCLETPIEQREVVNFKSPRQYNIRTSLWSKSPMSAQSIMSEDEDDYLFRAMSSVSSARSSISWAEDAVEAEFTDQLASLWEDLERVCGGEEKPSTMSTTVYEECLQWRRAFPQQTLLLPSRFANVRSEHSTPTPTNNNSNQFVYDDIIDPSLSAPLSDYSRPFTEASVAEDCLTPNPNNSSLYVSSWLSECQPTQFPLHHNKEGEDCLSTLNTCTASAVILPTNFSNNIFRPIVRKSNNVIKEETDSSDEDERNAEENSHSLPWGHSTTNSIVKVQRPVSSYAKGHLMTPMRIEPEYNMPPSYSPQVKHANFIKSTPNTIPNRIISSLPAGRTAPNLISSPPFNHDRAHETMSSSGYRYRKPYNYVEQQQPQKSRATLATINLNSTAQINFSLPSASPYWSRHTRSNSPIAVQEETNAQVEQYFSGDFSHEDTAVVLSSSGRKRPTNLILPNSNMTGECGDMIASDKPVKPFLFWLFDRVSPN